MAVNATEQKGRRIKGPGEQLAIESFSYKRTFQQKPTGNDVMSYGGRTFQSIKQIQKPCCHLRNWRQRGKMGVEVWDLDRVLKFLKNIER